MPAQSISALETLQTWGLWTDKARGRVVRRPWDMVPDAIVERQFQSRQPPDLRVYSETLMTAVLTELWSDARKGDGLLTLEGSWVRAVVCNPLVHPAVDAIDAGDEGRKVDTLYLELPHELMDRFASSDVICLREPQGSRLRLFGVRKLKRTVNQLLIDLSHVDPQTPPASAFPIGTSFYLAPFTNIRTRSAQLRAVQELAYGNSARLEALLLPQFPITVASKDDVQTTPFRPRNPLGEPKMVPEIYNRCSRAEYGPRAPRRPFGELPRPSPSTSTAPTRPLPSLAFAPEAIKSVQEKYGLNASQARAVLSVDSLEQGVALVRS